jgi:hypothetical protein
MVAITMPSLGWCDGLCFGSFSGDRSAAALGIVVFLGGDWVAEFSPCEVAAMITSTGIVLVAGRGHDLPLECFVNAESFLGVLPPELVVRAQPRVNTFLAVVTHDGSLI